MKFSRYNNPNKRRPKKPDYLRIEEEIHTAFILASLDAHNDEARRRREAKKTETEKEK